MGMDWLIIAVFAAVYAGMALGRWPGLAINRTGVAMIGAVVLFVAGAVSGPDAMISIDFHTLFVLLTLMVVSAQYAASGFFDWIGNRITHMQLSPNGLLAGVIVVAGTLSALMTNDVVVWAMTPILIKGLMDRGLDPRAYIVAVACAANAGSAATLIGNPQNLLIAHFGNLDFGAVILACGVPAVMAMVVVYGVIAKSRLMRGNHGVIAPTSLPDAEDIVLDRPVLLKAVLATIALLVIFIFAEDRATWSLLIVAMLLLSRKLGTDRVLGMVDWHLLALFSCLFIVTGAMAQSPDISGLFRGILAGLQIDDSGVLAVLSLIGSNTIGNVPLVMLLLPLGPEWSESKLYGLAIFSTLSGNFLIVGSVANIIAVERARALGVIITFGDYARIGIPVTLISLVLAWGWVTLAM
ncbi:MAG: SLC13 family permease [Pseudomonadota bacterium]